MANDISYGLRLARHSGFTVNQPESLDHAATITYAVLAIASRRNKRRSRYKAVCVQQRIWWYRQCNRFSTPAFENISCIPNEVWQTRFKCDIYVGTWHCKRQVSKCNLIVSKPDEENRHWNTKPCTWIKCAFVLNYLILNDLDSCRNGVRQSNDVTSLILLIVCRGYVRLNRTYLNR